MAERARCSATEGSIPNKMKYILDKLRKHLWQHSDYKHAQHNQIHGSVVKFPAANSKGHNRRISRGHCGAEHLWTCLLMLYWWVRQQLCFLMMVKASVGYTFIIIERKIATHDTFSLRKSIKSAQFQHWQLNLNNSLRVIIKTVLLSCSASLPCFSVIISKVL